MRKYLLLAVAAAGVVAVRRRAQAQQDERDLWAEATDVVPPGEPREHSERV